MEIELMLISLIIAMAITSPIAMRLAKRGAYRTKGEIIIEEAKAAGRVAQAYLVSNSYYWGNSDSPDYHQRNGGWIGTYSYTVNGKKYSHTTSSPDGLPETLTVYYPSGHPEKAISKYTYKVGAKRILLALFPVFVWVVVYQILIRLI